VFDLIGKRLSAIGDELRLTGRMFLQVKTVGEWWRYNLEVPERRAVVLDALWQVIVTLAGALLAEWLLRRVLERFSATRMAAFFANHVFISEGFHFAQRSGSDMPSQRL